MIVTIIAIRYSKQCCTIVCASFHPIDTSGIIQYMGSRDHEGLHFQKQPHFSFMTAWQYLLYKTKSAGSQACTHSWPAVGVHGFLNYFRKHVCMYLYNCFVFPHPIELNGSLHVRNEVCTAPVLTYQVDKLVYSCQLEIRVKQVPENVMNALYNGLCGCKTTEK